MKPGRGTSDAEVVKWLESPEGQRWSEHNHRMASRDGGGGKAGVFGELKTDYESCLFTGRCPDHGGSK